jgi:transcription elongation GreA/GreB family factor
MTKDLKQKLKSECMRILGERLRMAREAMLDAQESANTQDKSAAGDKFETARAMGQSDRDMNARQVEQAQKDLASLQTLNIEGEYSAVGPGALVECDNGDYFISTGLGMVEVDAKRIFAVSPASPMAVLMMGKRKGDVVSLNGKDFLIKKIW